MVKRQDPATKYPSHMYHLFAHRNSPHTTSVPQYTLGINTGNPKKKKEKGKKKGKKKDKNKRKKKERKKEGGKKKKKQTNSSPLPSESFEKTALVH